jgi:hypothetical protein
MSLSSDSHTVLDISGAAGEYTVAHDGGSSPDPAFVVAALFGDTSDWGSTVKWGTLTLTLIVNYKYNWFSYAGPRCKVYAAVDSEETIPSGSNTFSVTTDTALTGGRAVVYTASADVSTEVIDYGSGGGLNASALVSLSTGVVAARAFAAAGTSGGASASGLTQDVFGSSSSGAGICGHEATPQTGTRSVGDGYSTAAAAAALAVGELLRVGGATATGGGAAAITPGPAVHVPVITATGGGSARLSPPIPFPYAPPIPGELMLASSIPALLEAYEAEEPGGIPLHLLGSGL